VFLVCGGEGIEVSGLLMMAAASANADYVWLTSADNPRNRINREFLDA